MENSNKKTIVSVSLVLGLIGLIVVVLVGGVGDNGLMGKSLSAAAISADLSTAEDFSVLAALSMVANGTGTTISGDLGLSPGLAVSRTGTWTVGGTEYFGTGAESEAAQTDALSAFNDLVAQAPDGLWTSASPAPGVYNILADTTFAGPTLTLDGDFDDVWIFQIGQDMTFTGDVILAGNAQACNVFWQIGRDATITSGSDFAGTLIASRDVTVASGATVDGRIISLNSSLVFESDNTVSGPTCATPPLVPPELIVTKIVVNDNGGTKVISDFSLLVDAVGVTSGVVNTTTVGLHTVSETADPLYTTAIGGDCAADGTITLALGDLKTCTVTNDDIAAPAPAPSSGGGGGGGSNTTPPLIEVVKVPTPLALPNGPGSVTYTYTLRNIGEVAVRDIEMVGDTCSPIIFLSGDTDNDERLDVNETWIYGCTTTLTETHTNTVTATGWANGISATDIASATVVVSMPGLPDTGVVPPLIHITKVPSPLFLPTAGGTVLYNYTVTNPGTEPLSNVSVSDDKCTSLPGRVFGHPGDLNRNDLLESNEAWRFTCLTNLLQTTTNTVTAEGFANGLVARDFAIATVVVSVPGLPQTGFPPFSQ